jgi:hypothetical protein
MNAQQRGCITPITGQFQRSAVTARPRLQPSPRGTLRALVDDLCARVLPEHQQREAAGLGALAAGTARASTEHAASSMVLVRVSRISIHLQWDLSDIACNEPLGPEVVRRSAGAESRPSNIYPMKTV